MVAAMALAIGCHQRETPKPAQPKTATTASTSTAQPSTEVGAVMPAYQATALDGKPFDLGAQKGSVVLLNVWATWCGPCRGEIPMLKELHTKYASRGFEVVGVSVDEGGPEVVRGFVKENAVTYPIAVDAEGRIANLLQTTVLPTSLVIDRKGKIVWRDIGAIDGTDQSLPNAIEKALAAK